MHSKIDISDLLAKSNGCIFAPSLLSADFSHLADEITAAQNAGADIIHLDIMDGNFVPNITFGPPVVKSIIEKTSLTMDAHLMIVDPIKYGKIFAQLGVDIITAHIEVLKNEVDWKKFKSEIDAIAGIAINPPTKLHDVEKIVEMFEMILIMSVNPGFSGQKFIPDVLHKIEKVADYAEKAKIKRIIAVDGGINRETSKLVRNAGANFIVAGNAFFKTDNYAEAVKGLCKRFA